MGAECGQARRSLAVIGGHRVARDRGVGGALVSASSYLMKHPPQQRQDAEARADLERFLRGELAR